MYVRNWIIKIVDSHKMYKSTVKHKNAIAIFVGTAIEQPLDKT